MFCPDPKPGVPREPPSASLSRKVDARLPPPEALASQKLSPGPLSPARCPDAQPSRQAGAEGAGRGGGARPALPTLPPQVLEGKKGLPGHTLLAPELSHNSSRLL